MKKSIQLLLMMFFLFFYSSCEKDALIAEKGEMSNFTKENVETCAFYYCGNNKSCLPHVEISGDKTSAEIGWISTSGVNDRRFKLTTM